MRFDISVPRTLNDALGDQGVVAAGDFGRLERSVTFEQLLTVLGSIFHVRGVAACEMHLVGGHVG